MADAILYLMLGVTVFVASAWNAYAELRLARRVESATPVHPHRRHSDLAPVVDGDARRHGTR